MHLLLWRSCSLFVALFISSVRIVEEAAETDAITALTQRIARKGQNSNQRSGNHEVHTDIESGCRKRKRG